MLDESQEYIDIVDDSDIVIGTTIKNEIYKHRLQHRIVHILIFNKNKELALQLRNATRSFCPLHWSTSVGGHVKAGENYSQAALREFQEELGFQQPIKKVFKDLYVDKHGHKKFLTTFKTIVSKLEGTSTEEVEKMEYFSFSEIEEMIKQKEKIHPELLFLLKKHYKFEI